MRVVSVAPKEKILGGMASLSWWGHIAFGFERSAPLAGQSDIVTIESENENMPLVGVLFENMVTYLFLLSLIHI